MSLSIPFFIPDTSPIFTYSTCPTCDVSTRQEWQSAYSPRGDGYDVTFHKTKRADAVVNFITTALTIAIHSSLDGSCAASYSVDGSSFSSGCNVTLDGQKHDVSIQPQAESSVFEFYGVSGTSKLASDGRYINQTFDDGSALFSYTPNEWTHVSSGVTIGPIVNQSVVDAHSTDASKFFNSSASITTIVNGRVDVSFPGTTAAIYVYGSSDPDAGKADIYLDTALYSTLNFNNSAWKSYGSLLFLQTDFDSSLPGAPNHNISIISTTPGKQVIIDYAITTTLQPEKNASANLLLIIGSIGGSSAFLLVTGVVLYLWISRRKARAKTRGPNIPYPFNYDIGSAKINHIDNWRKGAAEAPSPDQSTSSGFTTPSGRSPQGASTTSSARRNGGGFGHPYGSPHGSPPPEYPDFVPYRGPIEPPPAAIAPNPLSPQEDHHWPTQDPSHASRDARVEGWVNNVHASSPRHSSGAETYRSYRTARSEQTGRTIHAYRSRDRLRPKTPQSASSSARDMIPLSPYRLNDALSSPVSELSSAGLGGMTGRAVRATGSVARVWTAEAVPSSNRPVQRASPTEAPASSSRRTEVDSMQFAPSYTIAGNFITSPDQLIGSRFNLHAPDQSGTNPTYASSRPSSPHSFLRRGVSIKSVKTMRSFFSGLLWNSSTGSPVPETPALPKQIQAARPDSGIFPITRNNSVMVTPQTPIRRGGRKPVPSPQGSRDPSDPRTSDYQSPEVPSSFQYSGTNPPSFPQSPPSTLRLEGLGGIQGIGASPQLFIELNPNSPVTMFAPSRPGSQMTAHWR